MPDKKCPTCGGDMILQKDLPLCEKCDAKKIESLKKMDKKFGKRKGR
jgi:hypothetical protein